MIETIGIAVKGDLSGGLKYTVLPLAGAGVHDGIEADPGPPVKGPGH
jgi:hypothetical protein